VSVLFPTKLPEEKKMNCKTENGHDAHRLDGI